MSESFSYHRSMAKKLADLNRISLLGIISKLIESVPDKEAAEHIIDEHIRQQGSSSDVKVVPKRKDKAQKVFDMSKYRQRTIACQVQYDGGPYFGFASQSGDCEETIEKHLFETLLKLRLIDDRQACLYSRCGRTDRGVSALGQIISLRVRSAFPTDVEFPRHPCDSVNVVTAAAITSGSDDNGVPPPQEAERKQMKEMDYCTLMNRSLPEDIRVMGWTPVTDDFSSRFSASSRTYRYFFIRRQRNIEAMQVAASHLLGDHDFRNLCKIDLANVTNFRREIYNAQIVPFYEHLQDPAKTVWMLEITGIAFLWHMIRCIMAVLLMVGDGHEAPEIILHLLDIDACPQKPNYPMAGELPLVLHSCAFDNLDIQRQPRVLWGLTAHYESVWERHTIAAARALNALQFVRGCHVRKVDIDEFAESLQEKTVAKTKGRGGGGGHQSEKKVRRGESGKKPSTQRDQAAADTASCVSGGSSSEYSSRGKLGPEQMVGSGVVMGGHKASEWHSIVPEPDVDKAAPPKRMKLSPDGRDSEESLLGVRMEDGKGAGGEAGDGAIQRLGTGQGALDGTRTTTVPPAGSEEPLLLWSDALAVLGQRGLLPLNAVPHVPMNERPRGEQYETRVKQMSGGKKERYERHVALKGEAAERDPDFFSRMRRQGTIE